MTQHYYGDTSNLNAPYRMSSVQGYGLGATLTWEGKTLPAIGYPWMQASEDTLKTQYAFNAAMAQRDMCPLLLDGEAGPRTCGALFTMDDVSAPSGLVATCAQHAGEAMEPKFCPGGEVPVAPAPVEEEVVEEKRGGIPVWVWGLGLGVLAVGAAIAMKKKKRR